MRLTRYLPSAWWRKRHCPREPEPWELSPQWHIANSERAMTHQSLTVHMAEVGPTREEKKFLRASALGRNHCNVTVKQALAGKRPNTPKLQHAYQGLTRKKAPTRSEDTGKNPRSCKSGISSVSRVSFRYCIVSCERLSAVQAQLHNASGLWMVEELFIQISCDFFFLNPQNWCSFVLYKGSTFLAPSLRLMGY